MQREAIIKLKVIVDLNVIKNNLLNIKKTSGKKVLFMVKANAYGHGLIPVCRATQDIVDMFGVATVEEGLAIRKAGIDKPILVSICNHNEIEIAVVNDLTIAVTSCCQLETLKNVQKNFIKQNSNQKIKVHFKLDTGMHRLGLEKDELECCLNRAKNYSIDVEGVYSHLRCVNNLQFDEFDAMTKITQAYFPNAIRHLVSSYSLYRNDKHYDMVRVGFFGYRNAMTVASEILTTRYIQAGDYFGYGNHMLDHNANIAIVFGGYADGVDRGQPSYVLIRGHKCKVVGKVCMDMFAVECNGFCPKQGEIVILQGEQLTSTIVAKERKTIDYTVLTAWRGRMERIYFDDESGSKKICKGKNIKT